MSTIDLHNEQIGIKVVYYGPGLGGKTSSLQYMHKVLKPENRGRLISLATGVDRTLYFDFLPIQLPKIGNFTVRMSVYTVPGQVHYDATRKLVLQGADGIVFVADSQAARRDANLESIDNLKSNLKTHGMNPHTIPLVLQYNKRDIADVMSLEKMDEELNWRHIPRFESCALSGEGVFSALKAITKAVLADLKQKGVYRDPSTSHRHPSTSDDTETTSARQITPDKQSTDNRSRSTDENSGSLAAAITMAAESRLPDFATHNEKRAFDASTAPSLDEGDAPSPHIRFSALWSGDGAFKQFADLEQQWLSGDWNSIIANSEACLLEHFKKCGFEFNTLPDALLTLGVCPSHYNHFKRAIHNTATSSPKADALFCLFFLTDMELRIQATKL